MTKMVEVPWTDGTTRRVDVGTRLAIGTTCVFADEGGYRLYPDNITTPRDYANGYCSWAATGDRAWAVLVEGDVPELVPPEIPKEWTFALLQSGPWEGNSFYAFVRAAAHNSTKFDVAYSLKGDLKAPGAVECVPSDAKYPFVVKLFPGFKG